MILAGIHWKARSVVTDLEVTEMDSVKNAEKTKCDDKLRDRKMIPDLYLLIKDK